MAENANTTPAAPQQPENKPAAATTPSSTPTKTEVVKPVIVQSTVRKGRKLSPKLVVIGCIGFIVVFILGLFGALYVGLQNPGKLANTGIAPSDVKSLLMIIAGVFFGVIFLFGFGFLAINTYRLIRNRGGKKAKYFAGMFFGFILLAIAVGLGAVAITRVSSIEVESFANTDELVIPYLITTTQNASATEYTYAKAPGIYVIAPVDIAFQLNEDIVNLKYSAVAGENPPLSMTLGCGNGDRNNPSQKVNGGGYIAGENAFFDSTCLYVTKGTYAPKITFTYRDPIKQQNQTFTLDAGTIEITAQLNVTANGVALTTNDNNSELIVGDAPARVQVDAKNIFSELGIADNNIIWDMDTDGTPDKENKVTFGYNYMDPQLYTISYRFPNSPDNLANLWYHFYLRVNQSDIPRCTIAVENDGNSYSFNALWGDDTEASQEVNSYRWEIYDIDSETTVQTIPARTDSLDYVFTKQGNYTARLNYSTVDDAKGLCESDVVHAGAPAYDIEYKIMYKKPGQKDFIEFPSTGVISQNGDTIIIDSLPLDIKVQVTDIAPRPASASLVMKLNGKVMQKEIGSSSTFTTTVSDKGDQQMTITVTDEQGTTSEKQLNITLNQSIIQGVLIVTPVKGVEPLTVTLDASTTKLNDDTDEILFFTWDFDDGETAKNVSQGKISHIYKYKADSEDIQYTPSVTVTTKKGYKATFTATTPISVTRKPSSVTIRPPENRTQRAILNVPLKMEMQSDGQIRQITWDFGDGNSYYCNDRSCSTTSHTYTKAGAYTITVRVNYTDREEASATINIQAQ